MSSVWTGVAVLPTCIEILSKEKILKSGVCICENAPTFPSLGRGMEPNEVPHYHWAHPLPGTKSNISFRGTCDYRDVLQVLIP